MPAVMCLCVLVRAVHYSATQWWAVVCWRQSTQGKEGTTNEGTEASSARST